RSPPPPPRRRWPRPSPRSSGTCRCPTSSATAVADRRSPASRSRRAIPSTLPYQNPCYWEVLRGRTSAASDEVHQLQHVALFDRDLGIALAAEKLSVSLHHR